MNALEKAQVLFEELESLRPLSAEDEQRIMQKFRLDWNYHSNHLEGNQLTFGETKALILFNITAQGKPLKDHIEMTGHNEAIEWIIDVIKEGRPMTESFIRHLHELLLKKPYKVKAITADGKPTEKMVNVGAYKSTPNHVKTKTGEVFRFASPEETPAKMHDLLEWYKAERAKKERNPIILAAEFHYKFIRIHPFDDGNGRLARVLMNFILMSYHYPPVVIKTEDKEHYFSVLRMADAGQFEPFVTYIAENLCHSLDLMIRGAKGEEIEEPDDIDKEIILLEASLKSKPHKIDLRRSKETILKVHNTSCRDLLDIFSKKASLFDKFYYEKESKSYFNDSSGFFNPEGFEKLREYVLTNPTTRQFRFIIYFTDALDESKSGFKHSMSIRVIFKNTHVLFSNSDSSFTSRIIYGQELRKAEIIKLVNSEMKIHKRVLGEYDSKKE